LKMPSLFRAWTGGFVVFLAGCQTTQLADPNDPNNSAVIQPDVLRNNLDGAADSIFSRVKSREITDEEGHRYLTKYANELLRSVKIDRIPPDRAWEYGEVFLAAKRWQEAKKFLEIAVKHAKNEDRRVNDSLRLARAMAQLGEVEPAIPIIRSTFSAPPQEKAPILISVRLEFTPAAQGKGHDVDVAKLLVDAVEQSKQTIVDPNTEAGAIFLGAQPAHIRMAYGQAIDLFESAGRKDLADQTAAKLGDYEKSRASL